MNDETGFAFMQLGALQCTHELKNDLTPRNLHKVMVALEWVDTGFVLAVAIEPSNRAGDVYAINNMYLRDTETGERTRALDWDYLPRDVCDAKPRRRAGVRIARSFAHLNADFALELPDPILHTNCEFENDVELVQCAQDETGRVVRLV